MKRQGPCIAVFALLTMFGFAASPTPHLEALIAIRHDRDDAAYVALGQQFPSVGKVGLNAGDGTLIAPQWVITAAHVARGMVRRSGGDFQVYFNKDEDAYAVAQVIVHPEFVPMGGHDVALLKLDRPAEGITPASLYASRDELGKQIVIVGHGDSKPGTGGDWVMDRKKRGATNEVDQVTDLYITFTFDAPPAGTHLEGTAGPGDSGGPAFIMVENRPHIAGVSSIGQPGENGPGTYGAIERYVRVSSYQDWITETMQAPPSERFVNVDGDPDGVRVVQGPVVRGPDGGARGGGPMGSGAVRIDELGLLLVDRNKAIQMVGKMDQLVPPELNALNLRPPAQLHSINGVEVASLADFRKILDALEPEDEMTLTFLHNGETKTAHLKKLRR